MKRNKDIVVMSQFNINGSRGADAGKFVSDYISRDSATEVSLGYRSDNIQSSQDGVAFTLSMTGIPRQKVLDLADHVQNLNEEGHHAIQQMVISFAPDYLIRQNLVPDYITIRNKGDYKGQYDDLRIRDSVRSGLQTLADYEGYDNPEAVGCIQYDTRHLHVHVVMYEDGQFRQMHGKDEKGVLKADSLAHLTNEIDRRLTLTKSDILVPSQKNLIPEMSDSETSEPIRHEVTPIQMPYVDKYLDLINAQKREKSLQKDKQKRQQDVKSYESPKTDKNDGLNL